MPVLVLCHVLALLAHHQSLYPAVALKVDPFCLHEPQVVYR